MPTTPTKLGEKASGSKSVNHKKADDKSHTSTQHKTSDDNKGPKGATKK